MQSMLSFMKTLEPNHSLNRPDTINPLEKNSSSPSVVFNSPLEDLAIQILLPSPPPSKTTSSKLNPNAPTFQPSRDRSDGSTSSSSVRSSSKSNDTDKKTEESDDIKNDTEACTERKTNVRLISPKFNINRGANFEVLNKGVHEARNGHYGHFEFSDAPPPPVVNQKFALNISQLKANKIYGLFFAINKKLEDCFVDKSEVIFIQAYDIKKSTHRYFQCISKNSSTFWLEATDPEKNYFFPYFQYTKNMESRAKVFIHLKNNIDQHKQSGYQVVCQKDLHFKYEIWEMNDATTSLIARICSFVSSQDAPVFDVQHSEPSANKHKLKKADTKFGPFVPRQSISESLPLVLIERQIGYEFKNKDLLIQAFMHMSMKPKNIKTNEILAFFGHELKEVLASEKVMSHIVVPYGLGTQARMKCFQYFTKAEFSDSLLESMELGRYVKSIGKTSRVKINAEVCEALLAAAFIDGGMKAAKIIADKFLGNKRKEEFISIVKAQDSSIEYQESTIQNLLALANSLHCVAELDLQSKEDSLVEIKKNFKNPALLTFALAHPSYIREKKLAQEVPSVASLGTCLASFFAAKYVIETLKDLSLQQFYDKLESYTLSSSAEKYLKKLKLNGLFLFGESISKDTQSSPATYKLIYSQLLGFMYLDGGIEITEKFFLQTFNLDEDVFDSKNAPKGEGHAKEETSINRVV